MKLIVGLGNPGEKYQNTRHNFGQRVIDSLVGEDISVRLYKPRSFMNLSGPEVAEQIRFHKLNPNDLLVIHDELDLPFGETKLQFGRSSAGHHGVDSVIGELGTNAFWRLRLGVGPRSDIPGDKFVLEKFTREEEVKIPAIIEKARSEVMSWLKETLPE
jgi:peptidyl-tRNA hydrolase, PTH1 family